MATAYVKPWRAEYAKSSRAACRTCENAIGKDAWRIAKVVPSTLFDGHMTLWHHAKCILSKPGRINSLDEVDGVDALRWDDRQKLVKYTQGGGGMEPDAKYEGPSKTARVDTGGSGDPGDYAIENAKSSRATCKSCNEKINKGDARVSVMVESDGGRFRGKVPAWRHSKCFLDLGWWVRPLSEMSGWDALDSETQDSVQALVKPPKNATKSGSKRKVAVLEESSALPSKVKKMESAGEDKELGKAVKKGASRRQKKIDIEDDNEDVPVTSETSKRKKKGSETTVLVPAKKQSKKSRNTGAEAVDASVTNENSGEFEKNLERQTKAFWALKDELHKHLKIPDLRLMLDENKQDVSGTEQALLDRCVDGMMFGALGHCPMCQSQLEYRDSQYKCRGFLTAWSKCTYSTLHPERQKGKWKIIPGTEIKFLLDWNKKQKGTKEERLLVPVKEAANITESESLKTAGKKKLSTGPLGGLSVVLIGKLAHTAVKWKDMIEKAGGLVLSQISEGVVSLLDYCFM